jgi:hypothetical protein
MAGDSNDLDSIQDKGREVFLSRHVPSSSGICPNSCPVGSKGFVTG